MLKSTIKTLELILVTAGLITTFLMLKGAVIPYSCELVFPTFMAFWSSFRTSCLLILSSPLYICIIINLMVLLIAVTSKFQHQETSDYDTSASFDGHYVPTFKSQPPPPAPPPQEVPVPAFPSREVPVSPLPPLPQSREVRSIVKSNLSSQKFKKTTSFSPSSSFSDWEEFRKRTDSLKTSLEPIQADMTRKSPDHEVTDSHSDDKEIEEDQDSMEATWKLITGGGDEKPEKKELRKSETFMLAPKSNNNIVQVQKVLLEKTDELVLPARWKELRKSETFNDTVSITRNGGMIRRDPSMSLDEFNKQVEAFIKKFNADMRLQRQESDQRFLEMINQGL